MLIYEEPENEADDLVSEGELEDDMTGMQSDYNIKIIYPD